MVALLDGVDTQSFAVAAASIASTFGMKVTAFGPGLRHRPSRRLRAGRCRAGRWRMPCGRRRVLIAATLTFAVFTVADGVRGQLRRAADHPVLRRAGPGRRAALLPCAGERVRPGSRRGTVASLLWAAFPLGGMAGGFANAFVVAHYGWPMMFYLGGGLPLLVALAMVVAMPESPGLSGDTRDSASPRLRAIAERIAGPRLRRRARGSHGRGEDDRQDAVAANCSPGAGCP